MARKKLPYQRGTFFQVPIEDARRVAVGLVADMDGTGGMLGFFFLLDKLPADLAKLAKLTPSQAVLITHCGDLGLIDGTWKVLQGPAPDFDRQLWQRLEFGFQQELTHRWLIRTYEPGSFGWPKTRPATEAEVRKLPQDGMAGSGWVEEALSDLAAEQRDKPTKPAAPPRRRAAA